MADYQKMYLTLFNAITNVIGILQKAQQHTEELYISALEPTIIVLENADTNSDIENET